MTKYHIKPRILTTVAALTLVPALALAQAGSGSGSDSPQGSPSDQSATGAGAPSGTMQPGHTSPSAGSMDSTRASIDPSEIQRVLGMDAALIEINSLNSENVKKLQQTLKDRGHYPGQVDGVVGPQTRAALNAVVSQQFALTRRLINQGQITGQLAASMGLNPEDITPVTGVDTQPPSNQGQPAAPTPSQPPSGTPVYPEGPQPDDSEMKDDSQEQPPR